MTKNYAVQVKHVQPFDGHYSVLAEVYGFYDEEDPSILHQIKPALVNIRLGKTNGVAEKMAPRVRLLCPALGVTREGRTVISEKYGTYTVYELAGLHAAHIEVLNLPELQEDTVVKSEVSRVMLGADANMIERIVAKTWAKVKKVF